MHRSWYNRPHAPHSYCLVCYNTRTMYKAEGKRKMTMYVLVENKSEGTYTASLIGWPAMSAQGRTEDEAMSALRRSLATQLKHAKIVPLDVSEEQPWLQTAGMFKDDPFADELDAVIADYRRERDVEDLPSTTRHHAA